MKKVSLSDLARELGVSKTLVSLVLNGKGNQYGIKKEVQIQVKDKAIELNYRPNQTARSLRSGKTYTLGLMLDDLSDSYQANICKHIEKIATTKGYNIIISTSGDSGRDQLTSIISKSVDGVILNSSFQDDSFNKLIKSGFPVVRVDHKLKNQEGYFVGLDYSQIIYTNCNYLLHKGHQKVAIAFDEKSSKEFMAAVISGAEKSIAEAKLPKSTLVVLSVDGKDRSEISNSLKEMKALHPELRSIICTNDVMTFKVIESIHEMGIKIPDDFSIISLYDNEIFSFTYPQVSANQTPYAELAGYTMELLMQQMDGNKVDVKSIELISKLVERNSC